MLIILAPMIMETPAAMEKNAVAEGMSRMRGMEVKSTLHHEPDPASIMKKHYNSSRTSFHELCVPAPVTRPLARRNFP
jgi:hypothetical protein